MFRARTRSRPAFPTTRAPSWLRPPTPSRAAAAEVLGRLRRDLPARPASPEAFVAAEATGSAVGGRAPSEANLLRRRFSVLKLLGAGAMGRVYLAHDTLLGQNVAVKLLAVG